MTEKTTPQGLALTEVLGPLPEPATRTDWHLDGYGVPAYTSDQMLAYGAQERAAERDRWKENVRLVFDQALQAAPFAAYSPTLVVTDRGAVVCIPSPG